MKKFSYRLRSEPGLLAGARDGLGRWALGLGLAEPRVDRLLLACNEAMSNVVRHAYAGAGAGSIELSGRLAASGEVVVEIRDHGHWSDSTVRGGCGPVMHGISIMATAVDQVLVRTGRSGTTVILVDRAPRAGRTRTSRPERGRPRRGREAAPPGFLLVS